jgi:hypothetical protein
MNCEIYQQISLTKSSGKIFSKEQRFFLSILQKIAAIINKLHIFLALAKQ